MRNKMAALLLPALIIAAFASIPGVSSASPGKSVTLSPGEAREILSTAGKVKPDLCEYESCGGYPSALAWATAWAESFWGGTAYGEVCEGPFENQIGHTQWACYGVDTLGFGWQVNVGPYGEWTYRYKT